MFPARKMRWLDALVLVTGFIALDWVSYFHPLHGLNITPWDPAPALGLVFVLHFGWRAALLIALAIFLGDAWIRDLPFTVSAALAVLLATGYGAIGEVLRRRLKSEDIFVSRRGLFEWVLIVVVGTLANSAAFIFVLTALGLTSRHNSSGYMCQAHSRVCFINVLTTRTRSAIGIHP